MGFNTLSEEELRVAYNNDTKMPFTGSLLDNKPAGTFFDPVAGSALFRSGTKLKSGTGLPSFFEPVEGAVTLHCADSLDVRRIEVRSTSSRIHLGHVFDDGPPPTGTSAESRIHLLSASGSANGAFVAFAVP